MVFAAEAVHANLPAAALRDLGIHPAFSRVQVMTRQLFVTRVLMSKHVRQKPGHFLQKVGLFVALSG